MPAPVHQVIADTDCPNGIGCSLTATVYDIDIPSEPTFIHAPLDPGDVDKDVTHTMAMGMERMPISTERYASTDSSVTTLR